MTLRKALLAATILTLPVAANAQTFGPLTGLYVGAGAGINIMQNEDISARTFGAQGFRSGSAQTRIGPAANVYVGGSLYGFRLELEGAYFYNTFKGGVSGKEQKFGPMVNALYDFTGIVPYVAPYVGVGVGYMFTQENSVSLGTGTPGGAFNVNKSTMGSLAYQGIIGAAMPLTPALALTLDYRFMGLVDHRDYDAVNSAGAPATARFSNDFNHTVMVGVRYTFGQTPPPPPPAPVEVAPAPISRSYLVFFDWDKATLTDRARQIVSEAAANSTKVQYTSIEVNGYTDTSGTPRYNQGLSIRRANAVAAELVKDGVPKAAIAIQGFGETHLLVATGPGVREPQNRRVEIIIK
jgi:OmpA-OmpF porin, OOP family